MRCSRMLTFWRSCSWRRRCAPSSRSIAKYSLRRSRGGCSGSISFLESPRASWLATGAARVWLGLKGGWGVLYPQSDFLDEDRTFRCGRSAIDSADDALPAVEPKPGRRRRCDPRRAAGLCAHPVATGRGDRRARAYPALRGAGCREACNERRREECSGDSEIRKSRGSNSSPAEKTPPKCFVRRTRSSASTTSGAVTA